MTDQHAAFLAALAFSWVGAAVIVLFICAIVAALVAPPWRRLTFFLITHFFLGPLGVGFVAVTSERPKRAPVAATPVVLTDQDLERLPYGGPHKGM